MEEGRYCFNRRNLLRKGFGRLGGKCYLCKLIMETTENNIESVIAAVLDV